MEVRLLLLFSIQLLKKKTSELWLCTEKLLYLHLTSNFNTIYLKAGSIFPLQYRKSSEDKFHVPKFCQESGLYGYCQGIQNIYNIYSQLLFSTYIHNSYFQHIQHTFTSPVLFNLLKEGPWSINQSSGCTMRLLGLYENKVLKKLSSTELELCISGIWDTCHTSNPNMTPPSSPPR